MHAALGESVSFGRFMSESLSWEKWSSFSQKRHVEEAERLAQQGSVAEKKAFFEAHYKRIAAKKAAEAEAAAALLEQENGGESGGCNYYTSNDSEDNESQMAAENQEVVDMSADENSYDTKPIELEIGEFKEAEPAKEPEVLLEIPVNVEPLKELENSHDLQNMVSSLEANGTPQIKKTLLKVIVLFSAYFCLRI